MLLLYSYLKNSPYDFNGTDMGGHGHGPPYKVPLYTDFKAEGIPQLDELRKALDGKGLKDPWIR